MGELLAIDPDLHWPKLTVFKSGNDFNKTRGMWFYRDVHGHMKGPFKSRLNASMNLLNTCPTSGAPLRTPFEHDRMWWWKENTDAGIEIMGPYEFEREADIAIHRHIQSKRDEFNNEYR